MFSEWDRPQTRIRQGAVYPNARTFTTEETCTTRKGCESYNVNVDNNICIKYCYVLFDYNFIFTITLFNK